MDGLNGWRNFGSEGNTKVDGKEEISTGYDMKRCAAKEELRGADGGVLSGVQRPAEKELLQREKRGGWSKQERKVVGKPRNMK